jgi:hypothetical protein
LVGEDQVAGALAQSALDAEAWNAATVGWTGLPDLFTMAV